MAMKKTSNNKKKIISYLIVAAVAFAFGRYSLPEKVTEKTKTENTEHKEKNNDKTKEKHEHKKTKTITIRNPDGSSKTVKIVDDRKDSNSTDKSKTTVDKVSKTETEKEVTYSKSKLTLVAVAAEDIHNITPTPVYGGMVTKEVLGPITVGGFGLANGMLGLGIGLSF